MEATLAILCIVLASFLWPGLREAWLRGGGSAGPVVGIVRLGLCGAGVGGVGEADSENDDIIVAS